MRGIAAIAVLLCHINYWEGKDLGRAHTVTPGIFERGFAGVDLFFVISGFIMVFIQPAPIDSRSSYLRFIINRFTRVYPPVWIVMLSLLPIYLVRPELFNGYSDHHVEIFKSFLLLPQDYLPLLTVAWTLIHEVYFYLVVSFALMFNLRGRWLFGCTWFLIVLGIFISFGETEFHQIRILQLIFSPFSLNFILGYFIGLLFNQIKNATFSLAFLLLSLGVIGMAYGFTVEWPCPEGVYPNNNHLFRFFTLGVPAALLVASAVALESRLPGLILKFSFLGDISYATYLIQVPFVSLFFIMLAKLHLNSPLLITIATIICPVICLMISATFHYCIELRITRKCREVLENYFQIQKEHKLKVCKPDGLITK